LLPCELLALVFEYKLEFLNTNWNLKNMTLFLVFWTEFTVFTPFFDKNDPFFAKNAVFWPFLEVA